VQHTTCLLSDGYSGHFSQGLNVVHTTHPIRSSTSRNMEHREQSLPQALVLRWNDYTLRVQCPYCLYSHGHAFAGPRPEHNVDRSQRGWQFLLPSCQRIRLSDCSIGGEGGHYIFVFPASDEATAFGCGWELDRGQQSFITMNSQGAVPVPVNDCRDGRTLLAQYEAQHQLQPSVDDLAAATENLELDVDEGGEEESKIPSPTKTGEEILHELYEDPDYRRMMYVSHCSLCELQELASLCRQYPDDHLIGSIDEEGNTGSLLAATQENGVNMLKWLHAHGGSLTMANHYGRTPLMEAALWGRLGSVRYLVGEGVDIETCDANEMRAIDLSDDTERNTKERKSRCGCGYREVPTAGHYRKQIQALLKRTALPSSTSTPTVTTLPPRRLAFFYRNPDGSLEIFRPRESVQPPVGKLQKAFATLDRGPSYPYINAMSGYTQAGWLNVLDNGEWTTKADLLRDLFGLPKDRSLASHVEPQLLAYLLDRHSLLLWDSHMERDLAELIGVIPDYSIHSIISISKPEVCDACKIFIQKFQENFPGFRVEFHCVGDSMTPLEVISI
jgi:hypothetical protein